MTKKNDRLSDSPNDDDWRTVSVPTLRPEVTNGEPRMRADLLPPTVWGSNLRALLTDSVWRRLSRETSEGASGVCEICGRVSNGSRGPQRPDCHEIWSFSERAGKPVQRLERLIALCKGCHNVQHIGRAESLGLTPDVIARLREVNGWTADEAEADLERAWSRFALIARLRFDLDLAAIEGHVSLRGWHSFYVPADDRDRLGNTWQPPEPGPALFDLDELGTL